MHFIKWGVFALSLLTLSGCLEDLSPDSTDLRSDTSVGGENAAPAAEFTATTTTGESVLLSEALVANDAVVLYFTMWCPLCDSHMSHMRSHIINNYPNVKFFIVDYVSGTIAQSRNSQVANGYTSLNMLADTEQALLNAFGATMASVIVIDDENKILMNEDYKNGSRLIEVLGAL